MATIDATKHGIVHTVGGTALQKRNSLLAGGPLTVAAGHLVAVVLAKDLPPPDAAGHVAVTMRLFEFLLLECFTLGHDFPDHQAWVAEVTAFSQMLADLDDGSMSWVPCSVEQLQVRFMVRAQQIAAARRTLPLAKLIVYTAAADFTDTCWDHISAKLLMARDPTCSNLVQFRQTVSHAYTVVDRRSAGFMELWDFIKTADGLDEVDDIGRAAGASKVATWFRRTRQDSNLSMFFDVDECAVEISRRMEDAEGRFLPLFEARYRDAFPNISAVLKKPCDGGTAAQFTTSMAIQLQNTQKLDGPIASAVNDSIENALPSLDTGKLRDAGNATRVRAVVEYTKGEMLRDKDDKDDKPKDAWEKVFASEDYKDLLAKLELHSTSPVDPVKVGAIMAKSPCVVGLAYMDGRSVPAEIFRSFSAVQTAIVKQNLIETALAVDKNGVAMLGWSGLVDSKMAVKIFKGFLSIGKGDSATDYWALVRTSILKREGSHAFTNLPEPVLPMDMFLNAELLRLAHEPLAAALAVIGFTGSQANSYRSFNRWNADQAQIIARFPESQKKGGLLQLLSEAVELTYKEAAERQQLMLKAALHTAKKETLFLVAGTGAQRKTAELEGMITRQLEDMELNKYSLGRGDDDSDLQAKIDSGIKAAMMAQQGGWQQQQHYGGWQQQEDWWASDQQQLPAGTSPAYGASAFTNGVWKKGDQLFFGPVAGGNLVTIKPGTDWDGWTSGCYGQLAHNLSASTRSKWCTTPVECWARAGHDAHDRPDGFTIEPDQCKVAPRPFDTTGWKQVFPPPGTKAGSTSKGGKGVGGKGGGKHGKGGKGKGGKGGKGKGKGKGEDTRSSIAKSKNFRGQRS